MNLWRKLPTFWRGFIAGGVVVPLSIVAIEVVIKLALHGEVVWK